MASGQPLEDGPPDTNLFRRIIDFWNLRAIRVRVSYAHDFFTTLAVLGVMKTGVIRIDEVCAAIERLPREIEVSNVEREPGHFAGRLYRTVDDAGHSSKLLDELLHIGIRRLAF